MILGQFALRGGLAGGFLVLADVELIHQKLHQSAQRQDQEGV